MQCLHKANIFVKIGKWQKRGGNIICEGRVICHFYIRTGVWRRQRQRKRENDSIEIAKWSQFSTANSCLLCFVSFPCSHTLFLIYLFFAFLSIFLFFSIFAILCHTHFVGCPQKGELKHVCQITHTHCVLCNLASAALCVCLRVCVAIRCCVPGCVIAFGAVFTCACIIRANVAHVIKSSGGRTRRRKCRALYAAAAAAVSAADIF